MGSIDRENRSRRQGGAKEEGGADERFALPGSL